MWTPEHRRAANRNGLRYPSVATSLARLFTARPLWRIATGLRMQADQVHFLSVDTSSIVSAIAHVETKVAAKTGSLVYF
jgi:hypothetical protein